MSNTEAMSCKLPLLDGEDTTRPRLTTIEFGLEDEDVESLKNFSMGDAAFFNSVLCTAWGLILRCYTGQDRISFHVLQDNGDKPVIKSTGSGSHRSTFQMEFSEQESLSSCVARAKDGYAINGLGSPSSVATLSDSRSPSASYHQNTHLWVQQDAYEDRHGIVMEKVFQSTSSTFSPRIKSDNRNRERFG